MTWISVREQMPEIPTKPWSGHDDDRYFLAWVGNGWRRAVLRYDHDDDGKPMVVGWQTDGEGWEIEPTHWMPGPEGP